MKPSLPQTVVQEEERKARWRAGPGCMTGGSLTLTLTHKEEALAPCVWGGCSPMWELREHVCPGKGLAASIHTSFPAPGRPGVQFSACSETIHRASQMHSRHSTSLAEVFSRKWPRNIYDFSCFSTAGLSHLWDCTKRWLLWVVTIHANNAKPTASNWWWAVLSLGELTMEMTSQHVRFTESFTKILQRVEPKMLRIIPHYSILPEREYSHLLWTLKSLWIKLIFLRNMAGTYA